MAQIFSSVDDIKASPDAAYQEILRLQEALGIHQTAIIQEQNTWLLHLEQLIRLVSMPPETTGQLQQITEAIMQMLQVDCCLITHWNKHHHPPHSILIGISASDDEEIAELDFSNSLHLRNLTRSALEYDNPLVIPDVHHSPYIDVSLAKQFPGHSALAIPLKSPQQTVLIITFHQSHEFTSPEIRRAEQVAGLLGEFLTRSRLLGQENHRTEIADTLHEISLLLTGALSTDEILNRLLNQIHRVIPYDVAQVLFIEEAQAVVIRENRRGNFLYVPYDTQTLPLKNTPGLKEIYAMREPVTFSDIQNYPDLSESESVSHNSWVRAWAGAPIIINDDIAGILTLYSSSPGTYSAENHRALSVFAGSAAVAINNARFFEEREYLLATARQTSDDLETVAQLSIQLSSVLDLQELLKAINHLTHQRFNLYHSHIYLLDKDEDRLILLASPGEAGRQMVERGHSFRLSEEGPGLVRKAALERRGIIINDVQQSHDWKPNPLLPDTRSEMALPMIVGDRLIGVLDLQSERINHFHEDDIRTYSILAAQIGVAVQHCRLFEAERQQRDIAETLRDIGLALTGSLDQSEVYYQILKQASQVITYSSAGIWVKGHDDRFRLAAAVGYEQFGVASSIYNLTFSTENSSLYNPEIMQQPFIIIPDTRKDPRWMLPEGFAWIQSWAAVNIRVRDEVVARLTLDNEQPDFYGKAHEKILGILGSVISVAVQNARHFEMERLRHQEVEALQESSLSLTSTLEPSEVLKKILNAIMNLVPEAINGHIFLYSNDQLTFGAGLSRETELTRPYAEPRQDGLTYRVARSGNPIYVNDIQNHPIYERVSADSSGAIMGVPLKKGDRVIGVMNIAFENPRNFETGNLRVLYFLATQATIAIENARLYQDIALEREIARTLHDTGMVMTATLDREKVLKNILQQVARVLPYDAAGIWLVDDNGQAQMTYGVGHEKFYTGKQIHQLPDLHKIYPVSRIFETHQAVVVPDTAADEKWEVLTEENWIASWAGAPITIQDSIMGWFSLDRTQSGAYQPRHQSILESLAAQISIAIQNARLYESERLRRQELETILASSLTLTSTLELTEVFDGLLTAIFKLINAHEAYLFTYYEGRKHLLTFGAARCAQRSITAEEVEATLKGIAWKIATSGKIHMVSNIVKDTIFNWLSQDWREHNQAIAGLPLKVGNQVVGTMIITYTHPHHFDEAEMRILRLTANQASIAIGNVRLFEEVRQERELADTLRDMGLMISSTLVLEDVLRLILEQVPRVVQYDAASVWLEGQPDTFELVARMGQRTLSADDTPQRFLKNAGQNPIIQQFRLDRRIMVISDVRDNQEQTLWEMDNSGTWIRSWIGAPIIVRDKIIGLFSLQHAEANFYGTEHQALLQTLATQISIAVGNARLFEAEQQHRQEIEAVQHSSLSLTGTLDLTDVLDAILRAVMQLVSADSAHIFLYDAESDHLEFAAAIQGSERLSEPPVKPRDNGLIFQVARTGKSQVMTDHTHPVLQDAPHDWLKTMGPLVGIPLLIGEKVVGVMNIIYPRQSHFEEHNLRALNLLASHASLAIENARLYKAEQEYASQLAARVEERTAQLELERTRLQAILDAMGEGLVYIEGQNVSYINRAFTQMTGYMSEHTDENPMMLYREILGLTEDDRIADPDVIHQLRINGVWRGERSLKRRDGTTFEAGLTIASVYNADGKSIGNVTVLRDISQEKALQEQKDRFISHASHELRTPLANIKTRLFLLKNQPERTARHMQVLEEVTDWMSRLVGDLLDVSRFERGVITLDRQRVILQEVIQDVVDIQMAEAEKKQIRLMTYFPKEPIFIMLDAQRFQQVITNLVSNAIVYTPSEHIILIEVKKREDKIIINVRDDGIGIPDEMLSQIFQPFFRASEGVTTGTGLGLTISKEIVELHQGTLSVTSVKDKGSTFTIQLPLNFSEDSD